MLLSGLGGDGWGHPLPGDRLAGLMARVRSAATWPGPADGPISPGMLLYLRPPAGADILVQWLILAEGRGELLLVPVDDYPLAGAGDCRLGPSLAPWPMVARCHLATWVPEASLGGAVAAGRLTEPALLTVLAAVRGLSPLAPGHRPGPDWESDDPELDRHLGVVQACLQDLVGRGSMAGGGPPGPVTVRIPLSSFRFGYPPEGRQGPGGLAAAGPGSFLDEVEQLQSSAGAGCRTLDHPIPGGLTLVLMANDQGILPALRGPLAAASACRISELSGQGAGAPLAWEPAGGLLVASRRVVWQGGLVRLGLPDGSSLELSR